MKPRIQVWPVESRNYQGQRYVCFSGYAAGFGASLEIAYEAWQAARKENEAFGIIEDWNTPTRTRET